MKFEIHASSGARFAELPQDGSITIGRLSTSDIVLESTSVSRRHAVADCRGGAVVLEDAGSRRGTFVNGKRLDAPRKLAEGDEIRIGDVVMKFVASGHPPAPVQMPRRTGFRKKYENASLLYTDSLMALQAKIHGVILSRLNAGPGIGDLAADKNLAMRTEHCLDVVMRELQHELPDDIPAPEFRRAMLDELLGYGPITMMLDDPEVTEVMVNGPDMIFVESRGLLYETGVRFMNEEHLVQVIKRIVERVGRHVDEASPMVDARLPDGSRVNAVIPPLALDGASLTIRKFAEKKLTTDDLIAFGSMTREMALFLEEAVKRRQNILVSGGTGSGKTTLLNILSRFIPDNERLVTIEDSAELKLSHRNIVRLEARPANIEGRGRITIRDLVVNSLRMRPDRIIVGECRGAEALDMLQAMNTGHDGSLTTAHANNPRDAMSRLENMVMMAGYELPSSAIREQIASAIDLVVQQSRLGDGSRKIVKIVEVTGREGDVIQMQDIFTFNQTGFGKDGAVEGYYTATGNIPYFIEELRQRGALTLDMDVFVPRA